VIKSNVTFVGGLQMRRIAYAVIGAALAFTPVMAQTDFNSESILELIAKYVNGKSVMPSPVVTDLTVRDDLTIGDSLTVATNLTLPGGTTIAGSSGLTTTNLTVSNRLRLVPSASTTLTNGQVITLSAAGMLYSPAGFTTTNPLAAPSAAGILAPLVNVSTNSIVIPATTLNVATTIETNQMILLYSISTSLWTRVN
jgi:hypothetical protein